jgi:glycosyltransferase involved in cell wall biosynthesis
MATPKVTILLATYNRPQLLDRAIESIVHQTLTEWELVVIDDGVDAATFEKMSSWAKKESRVRYFRIPRMGRIAKVSNVGLKHAKGEYVAILDDDDWWAMREKLQQQVVFLDAHQDYVACGGGLIVVDEKGIEKRRFLKPETDKEIKRWALIANPLANSTTLFRRSIAEKIGGYDETMLQFADWDFWLRMGREGKLYNFPEHFTYYLMWEEGASFSKQRENARSGLRIVNHYRGVYPGYLVALAVAMAYYLYSLCPASIKKVLNPVLSRLKKFLFSKSGA